ncbi:DUF4231 domain-containing protein [Kutzneria buriramensis]|nr:DUF4231 domain-containing protein [Kutzneria buriramensis]
MSLRAYETCQGSDYAERSGNGRSACRLRAPDGCRARDGSAIGRHRTACYTQAERRARIRHGVLELSNLVVTAAIPACAAFEVDSRIIAVLGSLIVAANGARQLFGWKEAWANRKAVRNGIEHELALYAIKTWPYNDEDAARRLVENVEQICALEREQRQARVLAYDPTQGGTSGKRANQTGHRQRPLWA